MIDKIKALAAQFKSDIIEVRRHIHAHPELSFEEYETSEYIKQQLSAMGIPYKDGYVKTGIVAHIEGKNPDSKTIALRADIDALPIKEDSSLDFCSKNDGVMHACGHDVHTASLLGAAKILNELKDNFEGRVKLIFQPGEERLPGGASLMIKEGALENPSASKIIGQHVYPDLPAGKVGFRPGMYMASADEIYVTVKGKGGHAALPHKCIDPILIASNIIVSLQQVISRNAKPDIPAVLSFGNIQGHGATNIIPDEVKIQGTFRTMNEDMRFDLHAKMKKMAESIAEGMGGSCDFDIRVGYPFLVNDESITERSILAAKDYLGEDNVVPLDLRMTAEDFAYYSQIMPGCFYRLGVNTDNMEYEYGLHNSKFLVNENALETGMGLMAYLTLQELAH